MKQGISKFAFIVSFSLVSLLGHSQLGQADVNTDKVYASTKEDASFKVNVEVAGESSFRIRLENPHGKKLNILITDLSGNVLVDASTTKKDYVCRYNFGDVEDGKYIIHITSRKERVIKEIQLNTVITQSRNINLQ